MTELEKRAFEQELNIAWKNYVDRGAATVDALEENTQELAFAKGFKAGCEQGCKDTIDKAHVWLMENYDKYVRAIGGSIYFAYFELGRDFHKAMEEQQ